jgi:hypothetical protein
MPRILLNLATPIWSFFLIAALSPSHTLAADELKTVVERENLARIAAVVEAINVQNRIVTLRSLTQDSTVVMEVGDEVRNLAQVKVGDRVVVEFAEALAVDLKKGGGLEPTGAVAMGGARAKSGEKPAGAAGKVIEVIATILAIDPDEPSVTLKGPKGNVVEVLVRDPRKLEGVDVGDQVVITYTRAVAIAIRPSPIQ